MTHVIRWCLALCALLISPAIASAQGTYPDRPIRFVVAFPPGGATDTFFRQISNELSQALGAAIVIENKGGAGGYVGWQYVASSPPDGYTFLVAENALGINPALYKKHASGFDPLRDYDAVVAMGSTPLVFTIANNIPANTFPEFVAWSKTQPQKFDYGSAGNGSVAHLVMEVILDGAGMQAVHVPYRGGGPAVSDLLGGTVQVMFSALTQLLPNVRDGRLRALAVTSATRSKLAPEIPTMVESGFDDFVTASVNFIVAPPGTPMPIRQQINDAVAKALTSPEVEQNFVKIGATARPQSPDQLAATMAEQQRRWAKIVEQTKIAAE